MGNEKQRLLESIEDFLKDKDDVVMGINYFPLPKQREYNVYFSQLREGQPRTLGHAKSPDLLDAMRSSYSKAVVMYDLLRGRK